jgi:chromosomal replication initiation ATPase DnaA
MSFETFFKDFTDYFVDLELSEFDKKRLEGMFTRNAPEVVVEKKKVVYKDVIKEKIVYVDKFVQFTAKEKQNIDHVLSNREKLISAICDYWVVPYEKVVSPSREQIYVYCRCHAFLLLREMGAALKEIGNHFNRDHTTVINGINSAKNWLETKCDPFYSMFTKYQKENLQEVRPEEKPEGILLPEKANEVWY